MSFSLVPPVPTKLIEKIESGKFVDMSELLSDHLGVLENEDQQKSSKPKRHNVTNILEWARCFALYTSILSRKQPQRIADLLGYQSLIILASMAYEGDSWQGYDRIFRQHARIFRQHVAVKSSCTWASIDAPLWNVAFAGKTMSPHCKHCFSFSYTSKECAWASDHSTHVIPSSQSTDRGQRTSQRRRRIFLAWNNHPYPGCPFPNCSFEHSCAYCINIPGVVDKGHKARFCPYQSFSSSKNGPPTPICRPY